MLNSVSEDSSPVRPRARMAKDERRRQLVGIGLRMLTERPIQDLSLDAVAAEAGISRGLLFHYFPTKSVFYDEVLAAAGRRVVRNVTPDEDASDAERLTQVVDRYIAQIDRRRDVYLALVHGNLSVLGGHEVVDSLRGHLTSFVLATLGEPPTPQTVEIVHAWVAYVEDRAIAWSAPSGPGSPRARLERSELIEHCELALRALLALESPAPTDVASHTSAPNPTKEPHDARSPGHAS